MGELKQRRHNSKRAADSTATPTGARKANARRSSSAPPPTMDKLRIFKGIVLIVLYIPFIICVNPLTVAYFFRRMTHKTCQGICSIDADAESVDTMCPALDTDRLIFLRIPKTASTSVKRLFQKLGGTTKSYGMVNLNELEDLVTSLPAPNNPRVASQQGYHDPLTQRADRRRYYQGVAGMIATPRYQGTDRYLYEGHLHYVDWSDGNTVRTLLDGARPAWYDNVPSFLKEWYGMEYSGSWGLDSVKTVAMMRHPFERLASVYYYDRSTARSPGWRSDLVQIRGNATLQECVLDEKCVSTNELKRFCSIQTEILCGIGGTECRPPKLGAQGLERAKANIKDGKVSFVGVTERLDESLKVMERMFPTYLEGVTELEVPMERENRAARREEQYTDEARVALEEICKVDLELYDYADRLLNERIKSCGVQ